MRRLAEVFMVATLLLAAPDAPAQALVNQRSAQSDCTREVERRGYRVVSTSNFKQLKDGWQVDVTARDQRGRTTGGTCFVETRSGDVNLYGFGWGGDTSAERYEFNCASVDGKYRECQLPVDGTARLVKRKSDAPCVGGQSWGQRGDRVWVTRGCRAQFEVVRGGGGGGSGQYVECRSQNERYRECAVARGYEGRLVRDYSGRCRKDSTWGNRAGLIWVTSGCQARFQLVPVRGGGKDDEDKDNPGQRQRAEVQCRNEATRQGIEVRYVAPATLRGSYWSTTVQGRLRGQAVQAACRFYPAKNRAELSL